MLRLLIVLCLLLPYISILTARVVLVVPLPERAIRGNASNFLDELFDNASDIIVWPNFQWPDFNVPNFTQDFFKELSKTIRNVFKTLQNQTMTFYNNLNNTFVGHRKKPIPLTGYNFYFRPFGNFSFNFGFSFNFQSSASFGHARLNFYDISSENGTDFERL